MLVDIFDCHTGQGGCYCHLVGGVGILLNKTAPTTNDYLAPGVNSSEAEKPWSTEWSNASKKGKPKFFIPFYATD